MNKRLTIFDYAPGELTQDAFLLWLFDSLSSNESNDDIKSVKNIAHNVLCKFLEKSLEVNETFLNKKYALLTKKNNIADNQCYEYDHYKGKKTSANNKNKYWGKAKSTQQELELIYEDQLSDVETEIEYIKNIQKSKDQLNISEVHVKKQYKKIDVLILFKCNGIDVALIIEDKVDSSTHTQGKKNLNQLQEYREEILTERNGIKAKYLVLGVYYKNRMALESEKDLAHNNGYAVFQLKDIKDLLEDIKVLLDNNNTTTNYIFSEYKSYIDRIYQQSYKGEKGKKICDYIMTTKDDFFENNKKIIFWNSFSTYFANEHLGNEKVDHVDIDGENVKVGGTNYKLNKYGDALCELGFENHKRYFFFKILLNNYPLALEFDSNKKINEFITVTANLYHLQITDGCDKSKYENYRKKVYDKFLNWYKRYKNLPNYENYKYEAELKDKDYDPNKEPSEIAEYVTKKKGNQHQLIATFKIPINKQDATFDYLSGEFVEMMIDILHEINGVCE